MKKLVAITLLALSTSSPAEADTWQDLLGAVIINQAVTEIYKSRDQGVDTGINPRALPTHNPLNESHRGSYTRGFNDLTRVCKTDTIRHGNYTEVIDLNCAGQVIGTRIVRR